MSQRKYPFGEKVPMPGTMTSGNTLSPVKYEAFVTTYKPNPFHGWRRLLFAFDEFNHRHGFNRRGPLRWLCTWWDRHL